MSYLYRKAATTDVNVSLVYIGVPQGHSLPEWTRTDLMLAYYQLIANSALVLLFMYVLATGNVEMLGERYN